MGGSFEAVPKPISPTEAGAMTAKRLLTIVLLGAVGFTICAASAGAAVRKLDPCPTPKTLDRDQTSIEQVVAGARERMPFIYTTINYGQGRHPRVKPSTSLINEVVGLSLSTREGRRLRASAAKFCGGEVAFNSWAVVVAFPGAATTNNQFAAFLAKTRTGWRLYGSVEQSYIQ
jgi:hypothetical protein